MKKNLLLTLLALPMICMGELFLEITKGSDNPFKVAIIPFAGSPKVSKPLHQIIQNDLDLPQIQQPSVTKEPSFAFANNNMNQSIAVGASGGKKKLSKKNKNRKRKTKKNKKYKKPKKTKKQKNINKS